MKKIQKTPKLENFVANNEKTQKLQRDVRSAEIKLCMFLHEHNLAFILMDHLPNLIRTVCYDSEVAKRIKCNRTKATLLTKSCIAEEATEQILQEVRDEFYSIIIDETTDIGTQKALALLIRYHNGKCVKDRLLGLLRLKSCTAAALFEVILLFLQKNNMNTDNIIGFAADNAAVMMGNKNGVQAHFKQLNENIFILGCVCHSVHLCSSAAAEKLPRSIEEFVRNIYNHFANSSQRKEILEEFQNFINIKPAKMLYPSQTRWLSLKVS